MQITALKNALPFLAKTNIPALIWGAHGLGKSQSVRQWCADNGYHFTDLRLGTQEVGDLLGLADFTTDPKTGQKIATKFMTPNWLKEVNDFAKANPKKLAVIFLDEFNRARRDVLQASFQLVLDKQLHTEKLEPNVYVLAASNPNTEDYIVTDIEDKALMDRFCHIKLEPGVEEWLRYADGQGFSTEVTGFIRDQKTMLQKKCADYNLDFVTPSRRSWEMVNRLIAAGTPNDILQDLCYGLVGVVTTAAFVEHMKNSDKPITGEDILKSYHKKGAKKDSKFRERIKLYVSDTGGRMDLVNNTLEQLGALLEKRQAANKELSEEESLNLSEFCRDIPVDFLFDFCRKIYKHTICRKTIDEATDLIKRLEEGRAKAGMAVKS